MNPSHNFIQVNDSTVVVGPNGMWYTTGGPGSNCTVAVCPVELSVYGYRPTLPGSATLIALYALCGLVQIVMGFRYKTWGFMTAMLLGCLDEIIGYIGRIMLYQNPWGNTGFIIQIVLITMGPVFFAAAIYVMIYKIIYYVDPAASRFKPKIFYFGFLSCDIVSLILQAVGGAMSSESNGSSQTGVNIALAGLSFQVATLTVFVAVVIDYAIRARHTVAKYGVNRRFKVFVSFLSVAIITIWIRCCYRVYELSQGYSQDSQALRDEPLFIGLESSMVIIAAYCLIVAHPGPVFNRGIGGPAEQIKLENEKRPTMVSSSSESEGENFVLPK